MPYDITTKDGITIRNIPDEVTPDAPELRDRVAKIRAAGGAEGLDKPVEGASKLKGSMLGGAWMGLRDSVDAGAQGLTRLLPDGLVRAGNRLNNSLVDAGVPGLSRINEDPSNPASAGVDEMVNKANAEYDASRKLAGRDGVDLARMGGNFANPINRIVPMGGASSALGVAGRAGLQGAVSGAFQPVVDTQDYGATKAAQIGFGGVSGAAAGYGLDKLGQAIGRQYATLRERPGFPTFLGGERAGANLDVEARNLIENAARAEGFDLQTIPKSILSDVQSQVRQALAKGYKPDEKALIRLAEGKAVLGDDAGLMLGQATRDPLAYARELDLRGIQNAGKPIADRLALQNERLIGRVGSLGAKGAPDAYDTGSALISNLHKVDEEMSRQVTAAYNKFRMNTGATIDVPLTPLAQKTGEVLDTFGTENIPGAVLKRLNDYGLMGGKQTKIFDLLEADKLIKTINANYDPMKGAQASALGQLRKGLEESIDAAVAQNQGAQGPASDMLKSALQLAKDRFRLHEAVPGLEAAAKDTAGKQAFVQKFITARNVEPDQLAGLIKLMSPESVQAMRQNVAASILERAAPGAGRGSDAAKFSQAGFNNALDAIGDRKLAMIFGDEGLAQLRQVGRVAEWIQKQPAGAAVNNPNTGAAVMNLLQGLAGKTQGGLLGKVMSLPGANIAKNSLAQALDDAAVSKSLLAEPPVSKPNLSPKELNALRPYLTGGGGLLGFSAASSLR